MRIASLTTLPVLAETAQLRAPPLIVDEVLTRRDRLHSFKERREWRFS